LWDVQRDEKIFRYGFIKTYWTKPASRPAAAAALLLLLLVRLGVYQKISSKEEDIGDPRECVLGCVQLIWIHGGQELVLFVLSNMYGAFQLHLGGCFCLQSG
jgi:hypothetical protein